MKFFRFWARGKSTVPHHISKYPVVAFGCSNESMEDALRIAQERANESAVRSKSRGSQSDIYEYGRGPLREEVIEELSYEGQIAAVITRNNYGALILNTSQVLFADVDIPKSKSSVTLIGILKSFFVTPDPPQDELTPILIERIKRLCETHRDLGIRLYRTKAGYRAAVSSKTFDPSSIETLEFMKTLGSDELYVQLCKSQQCFRARLTPKPWRIDLHRPPHKFPYANEERQKEVDMWGADYEKKSQAVVAWALVGQFGNPNIDTNIELVLKVHDLYACGNNEALA